MVEIMFRHADHVRQHFKTYVDQFSCDGSTVFDDFDRCRSVFRQISTSISNIFRSMFSARSKHAGGTQNNAQRQHRPTCGEVLPTHTDMWGGRIRASPRNQQLCGGLKRASPQRRHVWRSGACLPPTPITCVEVRGVPPHTHTPCVEVLPTHTHATVTVWKCSPHEPSHAQILQHQKTRRTI